MIKKTLINDKIDNDHTSIKQYLTPRNTMTWLVAHVYNSYIFINLSLGSEAVQLGSWRGWSFIDRMACLLNGAVYGSVRYIVVDILFISGFTSLA